MGSFPEFASIQSALEEIKKNQDQIPSIVESIVEAHLPKPVSSISITPAHLAAQVEKHLAQQRLSSDFKEHPNGKAVLTADEQQELTKASKVSEKEMVEYITPFLWKWIHTHQNDHRCLVNSEELAWLVVEPGVKNLDRKPDLFIGPYYVVNYTMKLNTTSTVTKYPYVFGTPMNTVWYDSIFPIAAKCKLSGEAFGEEIIYLKYLGQGPHFFSRGMVFAADKFYLLTCHKGEITSRVIARWTDGGSGELIQNFFSVESKWESAIKHFCDIYHLIPVKHLGVGGTARVIEVIRRSSTDSDSDGPVHFALKVVLEEQVDQMSVEYERIGDLIETHQGDETLLAVLPSAISDFNTQLDGEFGSPLAAMFLMDPIGAPLVRDQVLSNFNTFLEVFQSLRTLHQRNICHGDPRLPNLLKRISPPRVSGRTKTLHAIYYSEPIVTSSIPSSSISSSTSSSSSSLLSPTPSGSHSSSSDKSSYFWVDFMVYGSSALVYASNPSHRFDQDLLLFLGHLIGKKQTRETLASILGGYLDIIKHDDQFEAYSQKVFDFINMQSTV